MTEGEWIGDLAQTFKAATPCGGSWPSPHVHFFIKHLPPGARIGDPFQNTQPDVDLQDIILAGWKVTKTTPAQGCMTYLATGNRQCSPRGVITNLGTTPTPSGETVPTTTTTTTTTATTTTQSSTSPAAAAVRTFFAALGRDDFNGAAQAILPQQRSCFLGDYTTFPVHVRLSSVQIGAIQSNSTSAQVKVKLTGHATTPYGSPAFPSGTMRAAAVSGHWYLDYEHSVIFQGPCLQG